jgi:hypothetical protein
MAPNEKQKSEATSNVTGVVSDEEKDGDDQIPEDGTTQDNTLPPADGGRSAFQFLLGAFMIEAILWGGLASIVFPSGPLLTVVQGFPLAFGVSQTYYSKNPKFQDSRYVSVTGTLTIVSVSAKGIICEPNANTG